MLSNVCKSFTPARSMLQSQVLTRSKLANFSIDGLEVNHDANNNQFYIVMSDSKAFIDYEKGGTIIKFLHTEVPEIFRGKGVAKILANEAFTYAIKNNLIVQIDCEYLMNYYETNKSKYKSLKIS